MIWNGTIIVTMMAPKTQSRPGKVIFANTKPASELSSKVGRSRKTV